MRVLVPQGIGDSVWCLFKVQDLVRRREPGGRLDVRVACWHNDRVEVRALDFLRRFRFIDSAEMYTMPRNGNDGPVLLPGPVADSDGYYRYIEDGPHPELPGVDYVMIPNAPLERGIRLERWLPELSTNWDIMDDFTFEDEELDYAECFGDSYGPFSAFYMSSLAGNTTSGHNRNGIWSPQEWVDLGNAIHDRYGCQIVVVGTSWDMDYYKRAIAPRLVGMRHWHNFIDKWPIAQTYAVLRKASFVVSYQSGIGIVSHYFGKPVAIFWRPKGDSISPGVYVSFDEGMASAWARPDYLDSGRLLPCIYGRHKGSDILDYAESNGWVTP